jgi:hypothetical protein
VRDDYRFRVLRARANPPVLVSPYEFVILDEVQDMTGIIYWLTCILMSSLRLLPKPPKVLLLGDPRQTIYGYQGADARYLEFGQELLSDYTPYPWQKLDLAESFRLSHENASLVNTFLEEEYIEGSHNGPKPTYIHCNPFDKRLATMIHSRIKNHPAEECAIIAPSVRRNRPLAVLTNRLSGHREEPVPVAEPIFEEGPLDDNVLRGKLAVATYHQFKGMGRKVVIVFGVDASFFRYSGRNLPDNRCPNPIFVAVTRAKEELFIIHSDGESALPFLDWDKTMQACDVKNLSGQDPVPQYGPGVTLKNEITSLAVTDLLRYVPSETLEQLIEEYVDYKEVASPSSPIEIPTTVPTMPGANGDEGWHESVRDLTGMAVTAHFEWVVSQTCTLFRTKEGAPVRIPKEPSSRWFARQAAIHSANRSGYRSRLNQLNHFKAYGWLGKELRKTTKRLVQQFKDTSLLTFEQPVGVIKDGNDPTLFEGTHIVGHADIVERSPVEGEPPTIWEVKFVESLSMGHIAQVVFYGFRWFDEQPAELQKVLKFPRLVLFNVRDGTKWEIAMTFEKATTFAREVLRARDTGDEGVSDADFLERCRQVREEVARVGTGTMPVNSV